MSFQLPRNGQHTAIVGRTGTGKSQLGAYVLSKRDLANSVNIVIDYKGEELFNALRKIEEIDVGFIPQENGLYIIHADPEENDAMEDYFRKIRRHRNIGLFIDEGYMIPHRYDGPFQALMTQGRSLNIPIIACTQRPVAINRFTFSESSHIVLLDLNDDRDRDTMRRFTPKGFVDWVPPEFGAGLDRLPNYHAKWYNVANQQIFALRPVPSADQIISEIDAQLRAKQRWI